MTEIDNGAIIALAREASARILAHSAHGPAELGLRWKGENDPVTAADRAVHELCLAELARLTPEVPLVSEEGEGPAPAGDFWSLDPVDGTSEFVADLGEYAFQLALVRSGKPVLAVLALPALDLVYLARAGGGCLRGRISGGDPVPFRVDEPLRRERLVLTRSLPRRPSLSRLAELHAATEFVLLGGVGYKVHALLAGEGDTYFAVPGTLHPWDLAAPLLVALEAGLQARDLEGGELAVPPHRDPVAEGVLFTRERWLERNLGFFAGAEARDLLGRRDRR